MFGLEFLIPILLGGAIGGFTSAMNDQDPLLGMGLGGLFGGATAGIGQFLMPALSGAMGGAGAAGGALGAEALGSAATAAAEPLMSGIGEGALAPALIEASTSAVTPAMTAAELSAANAPATLGALEGANIAGMEPWWQVPQYMQYGGDWGGSLNQIESIVKGAWNDPLVKSGVRGGQLVGDLQGQQQQPVNLPNWAMAYGAMTNPYASKGFDIGRKIEMAKQVDPFSYTAEGMSGLGNYNDWNYWESDYGTRF